MQVGKTVNGVGISTYQLKLLIRHIRSSLSLSLDDVLIDLGCGNGLVSRLLSCRVHSIYAYDFSAELLNYARTNCPRKNIHYAIMDLRELESKLIAGGSKYLMYEVIQHLSVEDFCDFLKKLDNIIDTEASILIGGIPDFKRIKNFYDTPEKYSFYLKSEERNEPHMGTWWMESDLNEIAEKHNFRCHYVPQPLDLYTSHYRFDILLKRNNPY